MRLNVCFNEIALYGPFAALIKGCGSYGRNGGQPTRGDGFLKISPLRDLGFLKISCIFLLCVECMFVILAYFDQWVRIME